MALTTLMLASCTCSPFEREEGPVVQTASSSSSWTPYSRGAPSAPDPGPFEAELHGALVVPPERALVTLHASIVADSRSAAVRRVEQTAEALRQRVEGVEGCSASVWSYGETQRDDDESASSATLRLDIDLRRLESVAERHQRIEQCLAPYHDLPPSFEGLRLSLSSPWLTIDDPGAHRAALLEQHFAELRAVEAAPQPPSQFRASDLRCTSSGAVTIVSRSLHGVGLSVDFTCTPATASPVQATDVQPVAVDESAL